MARKKEMTSQLNNLDDFIMRFKQMKSMAKNVLDIRHLKQAGISPRYLNSVLLEKAGIGFYVEPDVGLVALPFEIRGRLDIYGEPLNIQCFAENGQRSRILSRDEFVIMYDNTEKVSILPDIRLYAQRMSQTARAADINISQQRTPRIIKGSKSQEATIKSLYNKIDYNEEIIYAMKDLDLDDIQIVLAPAPYVADKLDAHSEKVWNEFCRLIGVSDLAIEKKERLIKDEVQASQGGAIASRYSRYTPRLEAVEEINKKFADYLPEPLEVVYYDTMPDSDPVTDEEMEVDDYEE